MLVGHTGLEYQRSVNVCFWLCVFTKHSRSALHAGDNVLYIRFPGSRASAPGFAAPLRYRLLFFGGCAAGGKCTIMIAQEFMSMGRILHSAYPVAK